MPEEAPRLRPFWSGTITFGLVSVPVALYPANRRSSVSLRMLSPDGTPLRRRYFCPEEGREVPPEQIVRGYDVGDGRFVIVEDEELEALAPERSRDIDLRRFVPREDLDPRYFDRAYFLTPGGESAKAYRLLAAVMESTGRAGVATFVMRGKEYLVAILAEGGILRAETLRFADELRRPQDVGLPEVEAPPAARRRELEKAVRAVRADQLELAELEDTHSARLREMAEGKRRRGRDVVSTTEAEPEEGEVPDLMNVLKWSLQRAGGERRPPRTRTAGASGLEEQSKADLYRRAQELEIPGRSRMSKDELIRAIRRSA